MANWAGPVRAVARVGAIKSFRAVLVNATSGAVEARGAGSSDVAHSVGTTVVSWAACKACRLVGGAKERLIRTWRTWILFGLSGSISTPVSGGANATLSTKCTVVASTVNGA